MQFSRDLLVPDWYSKFNVLARMCAMYDHHSCWVHPDCRDPVVVQCGDGRILGPDGIEKKPHLLVLHDWDDRYAVMLDRATKVITFGKVDGAPGNSTVLESFPVPELPEQPRHPDNDVLIAGQCTDDETLAFVNGVLEGMDRSLSITVALYDRGSFRTEKMISGLVYGETMSSFGRVAWKKRQTYPMITALYRTAGQVVHCGSGRRGFLHALAVRSASAGTGLVTRRPDNDFEPSTIGQFMEAIGKTVK
jgi:hypothetical protein